MLRMHIQEHGENKRVGRNAMEFYRNAKNHKATFGTWMVYLLTIGTAAYCYWSMTQQG